MSDRKPEWRASDPSGGYEPRKVARLDGYEYDMRMVSCQGEYIVERTALDELGKRHWRRADVDEVTGWLVHALWPEDP